MTWTRSLFVPLILATLAPSAPAGFFSRKSKINPAERVPELLIQLKSGQDEGERTAAAEELRQYDPKSFPELVPGLIDALGHDNSPAVRSEAASSLGRLRPISQQAGYALEQATNGDATLRVRLAARQALLQYHIVGYRAAKTQDAPTAGSQLAPGDSTAAKSPRPVMQPTSRSSPGQLPGGGRESVEPPLATPAARPPANAPPPVQVFPVNPGLQPVPRMPEPPRNAPPPSLAGPALPPPG